MEQQVKAKVENEIMTITVDNPGMKNGLNWIGLNQLADYYQQIIDDENIRLGIVTATGEYFYTGGRVDPNAPGEQPKYALAIRRATEILGKVQKPMIAAINGHCLKAGMSMLANCDIAVAKAGIRFGFPEVRMGGVPMMVLVDIADQMPRKKAIEYLLTSWEFSADEALTMGLVNRIVPENELWPTVNRYAQTLLETPKELVEMTLYAYKKVCMIQGRENRFDFASEYLADKILPTMAKIKQHYNP